MDALLERLRLALRMAHYSCRTEPATRSRRLPVVFTPEEARRVLDQMNGVPRLVADRTNWVRRHRRPISGRLDFLS